MGFSCFSANRLPLRHPGFIGVSNRGLGRAWTELWAASALHLLVSVDRLANMGVTNNATQAALGI